MAANPCFLSQVTPREIDKALTLERVSAFWRYAKENHILKGESHYDAISQMAKKFNIPERVIVQALNKPKSVYRASEEVRARQRTTSQFLGANKRYLSNLDKSGLQRAASLLSDGVRNTLLAFHGPVIPITHGLDTLQTTPIKFIKTWVRAFKSLNPKVVDRFMAKMEAEPLFKTFKDAGAVIGREDVAEGFRKTGWAANAMEAMKPLRFDWMKAEWEKLPSEMQTKEMAHELALQSAHATGAMLKNEPAMRGTGFVRKALLAPQLTFSKWAKTVLDPLETINTFTKVIESKINKSVPPPTPEARRIAWVRTRNAGKYLGVTLAALKLNQWYLEASGSNQKVNLDDPRKGDFLAFKVGGHYIRIRGTTEVLALIGKLAALGMDKPKFGAQSPEEAAAKYAEYKLHPGIGVVKELTTGRDIFGRPVPWSSDPGNKFKPRLEVPEYVAQKGPIFLGHAVSAVYDGMREQGMDTKDINQVMRAITKNPKILMEALAEGGAEFFGVNLQKDYFADEGSKVSTSTVLP